MRLALALVLLSSCAEVKNQARLGLGGTGSAYGPGNAGAAGPGPAVAAALGAAVGSRALGGCVASCPPGTGCNEQTGLCEAQPCRGQCAPDEICQNERCVPMLLPGLVIDQK